MIKRSTFLGLLLLLAGCGERTEPARYNHVPKRIVSLAPNITETIYALGLGGKLVGATTYCLYPEEAAQLPRVGGFGEFNFESIVALKPDLVILHAGYENEKSRLDGLGIPYIATRTRCMKDILASIDEVGEACGAEVESAQLLKSIRNRLDAYSTQNSSRPRVLVTFGGTASNIDQIHAFGRASLHNEMLEIAGGTNVVENNLPFATLSKEAVIRLDPEIIVQLAPGTEAPDDPAEPWRVLAGVSAVKANRIYVLTGDYTCIPGPRFIRILEDLAGIIHP